MKLSLKQKALLITIAIIGGAFLSVGAITLVVQNVPAETIANAFGYGFIAWLVYLMYGLTLSRLEYQETLKKLNETVDKK